MAINNTEVTIWVAARNEAEKLPLLLDSLVAQDFPKGQLTILIGNDQSDDDTLIVARAYQEQYSYIHCIDVPDYPTHLRSKSRVLNYLARHTNSNYVLVTDADIILPPKWISTIVGHLTPKKYAMVSGITTMLGKTIFSQIQGLDWLTALFTISLLDRFNVGVTALGNNMGFDFKVYQSIGGYEKLPASIVEDFQLYMAFRDAGHATINLYEPSVLAITEAPSTWSDYIKQRTRWFSGGMETAGPIRLVFFSQFLYYPVLAIMAILHHWADVAIALMLIRYFASVVFTYIAWFAAGKPKSSQMQYLLPFLFEFYFFIGYGATILAYFSRKQIEWKGRNY